MDIIYDILQFGVNKFLFNYTVNSDTPVFILVFTNPWTAEEKTVTLNTPEGDDGEWIFDIEGVSNIYEALDEGKIEFENVGTWEVSVSESGNLIKNINLQVIEAEDDMAKIKSIERTLTSAQILTLNATPVELIAAPGAGKAITPMFISGIVDFQNLAYATQTSVAIRYITSQNLIATLSNLLNTPNTAISSEAVDITTKEVLNQGIELIVLGGNPDTGDSPVQFTLIYSEETLS